MKFLFKKGNPYRFKKGHKSNFKHKPQQGFQKGHPFYKGGEKGWFKKGQPSSRLGTSKIPNQTRICQNCGKPFQVKYRYTQKYCSFGCRKITYWLGKKRSLEDIEKLRKGNLGRRHTEEELQKMRGHVPWNKGLHIKLNDALDKWHKNGGVPWQKGTKGVMKAWNKGKKGVQTAWNKGKEYLAIKGEKNPNWNNGSSFEPYGLAFNEALRKQIRQRDNFTCQECGYTQAQVGYKLHVHHIDYNKQNNNPNNLITLCRHCHTKTIFNREHWIKYYQDKVCGGVKI